MHHPKLMARYIQQDMKMFGTCARMYPRMYPPRYVFNIQDARCPNHRALCAKKASQDTLDNSNFAKFSRECPALLDRRLTRTEVDLIFTKAKPKFERRLDFTHFLDALSAMASKKYPKYDPTTAFSIILSNHVFKLPCAPLNAHREAQQDQFSRAGGYPASAGGYRPSEGGFLGAAAGGDPSRRFSM